ncbi:hypothetical protein Tsubulata_041498 [Turnera subulata]|uniref:Uncharacterized protein n=1 Tax=Turnera subulata TaxID=218843 RepID=A0A9Q0FPD6_9ROSI|nr:hypothetical protein Tsubulata_041498 [Turnera subulata]
MLTVTDPQIKSTKTIKARLATKLTGFKSKGRKEEEKTRNQEISVTTKLTGFSLGWSHFWTLSMSVSLRMVCSLIPLAFRFSLPPCSLSMRTTASVTERPGGAEGGGVLDLLAAHEHGGGGGEGDGGGDGEGGIGDDADEVVAGGGDGGDEGLGDVAEEGRIGDDEAEEMRASVGEIPLLPLTCMLLTSQQPQSRTNKLADSWTPNPKLLLDLMVFREQALRLILDLSSTIITLLLLLDLMVFREQALRLILDLSSSVITLLVSFRGCGSYYSRFYRYKEAEKWGNS